MYESTCPFAVNGRDKVNMRGREERVTKKNNNGEDPSQIIYLQPLRVRTKARALCSPK